MSRIKEFFCKLGISMFGVHRKLKKTGKAYKDYTPTFDDIAFTNKDEELYKQLISEIE